jgi:uncharacterized protein YjiS (DUF1127 family)
LALVPIGSGAYMQCSKLLAKTSWKTVFSIRDSALPHRTMESAMLTVTTFTKRLRNWARYRNTVRELSQLTDRDLADLGIARGDIRFVAKKHARG